MSEHDKMNSLEELFKRKAGEYDIPFNEEDWNTLERRLDERVRQRTASNRRKWLAAAAIFLLSLIGYFTYRNTIQINRLTQQLTDDSVPRVTPSIPSGEFPGNDLLTSPSVSGDNPEAGVAANPDPSDETEDPVTITAAITDDAINRANGEALFSGSAGRELMVTEITCDECTFSSVVSIPVPDIPKYVETSQDAITEEEHADGYGYSIPIEAGDLITAQQTPPRASLGLAFSPDLSTAGTISRFQKPGYKIGLTAEFNLNEKFSLVTGIIQSEVYYRAGTEHYNPPVDFYSGGVMPSETFADCIILDLPIAVKYNFVDLGQSRFFATAGITSYIMLSEEYRFDYYINDPGYETEWNGKTGKAYWFSNAGLSIGYELDVHPDWSIRAEPFLKVPVREVGWGQVKLYSLGTFVSLNYRFNVSP